MVAPSEIYTPEFYEREAQDSRVAAELVLPLIVERYEPRSLVDVGCGAGEWVRVARDLGLNAYGVDGPWCPGAVHEDLGQADSVRPHLDGVDLAICLEVSEHLPPERAPSLVAELCTCSLVLWSAAVPGQCGDGHINEQPEEYWEALFEGHGMHPDRWIRRQVFRANIAQWYRNNLVVYSRDNH